LKNAKQNIQGKITGALLDFSFSYFLGKITGAIVSDFLL
jgi:hypothetical protein